MNFKKMMIILLAMSLIIVAAVVMIVHNNKKSEPKPVRITADSAAIGTWETKDHSSSETTDHVYLIFDKKGKAHGSVGKYSFSGTWQKINDERLNIVNKDGKTAYVGNVTGDIMEVASQTVTDSMHWTLYRIK